MTPNKMLVVGVEHKHTFRKKKLELHPDLIKTLEVLKQEVKPGTRVGLEITRRELNQVLENEKSENRFFPTIALFIRRNKGVVIPLSTEKESKRIISNWLRLNRTYGTKEQKKHDKSFEIASLAASHKMLERMIKLKTNVSIVGAAHARHIERLANHLPLSVEFAPHGSTKPEDEIFPNLSGKRFEQLREKFKKLTFS